MRDGRWKKMQKREEKKKNPFLANQIKFYPS